MVSVINPKTKKELKAGNDHLSDEDGVSFQKVNGVVRIAGDNNYTANFGFQWNKFQKTQIDRELGITQISKERFFTVTGWDKEDLTGKDVLEAGSGAGRFTQIVLDYTNANLYSFDFSDAVSANYRNNGHHGERLKLFQASIYEMPFPDNSFDKVFCFGVLQHTPDFRKAIDCLIAKAKPGAEIVVDFYPITGWWSKLSAKYLLRPFTKRMDHEKLLRLIDRNADWLIRLHMFFYKAGVGRIFNRFLPICDISHTLPANLDKRALREWTVLDTFDMFSPEYDNPQTVGTVKKWFEEAGADVSFAGVMRYGFGIKVAVVKGIKK